MKENVCHCLKVRRASNSITKTYDKYLTPSGISVSQFSVMEHISKLSPVTVSELALECQLDRTTLVRNLKTLEEKGYVSDISEKDSRKRQLVLTTLGRERLDDAEILWSQAQEYIRSSLGESDLESLTEMMSKIERICK
jgi:DNA-binding MarR family transcriptional regulator